MSANTASDTLALSERMKIEMAEVGPQVQVVRKLKIEADGDRWKGLKPKIRLIGRWLERAGFKPGNHVRVTCISPGVIEVRSLTASGESAPKESPR